MDDSCCCYYTDDYEEAKFCTQYMRAARKVYRCDECGHVIEPGESYEYYRGLFEWGWDTYRTCWFCVKVRDDFFQCGYIFGGLREAFSECYGWDYVDGPQSDDLVAEESENVA